MNANDSIIHIRIHIIHFIHIAQINCFSVTHVFVLPKYLFDSGANLDFKRDCPSRPWPSRKDRVSHANYAVNIVYPMFVGLDKVYVFRGIMFTLA
jgi:hypothetical protein